MDTATEEEAVRAAVDSQRDEMKRAEGSTATWTFLATAVYLHWRYAHFAWYSIPLVVVGMFAAAVVVGISIFLIKQGIIRAALRGAPSGRKDALIYVLGVLLFLANVALTIWLTRLGFFAVYGTV